MGELRSISQKAQELIEEIIRRASEPVREQMEGAFRSWKKDIRDIVDDLKEQEENFGEVIENLKQQFTEIERLIEDKAQEISLQATRDKESLEKDLEIIASELSNLAVEIKESSANLTSLYERIEARVGQVEEGLLSLLKFTEGLSAELPKVKKVVWTIIGANFALLVLILLFVIVK